MKLILCALGIHDWTLHQLFAGGWFQCERCGLHR